MVTCVNTGCCCIPKCPLINPFDVGQGNRPIFRSKFPFNNVSSLVSTETDEAEEVFLIVSLIFHFSLKKCGADL